MATITTNFGWDIPQSTDLVKDGATAIALLGQDIDTALVGLKSGATGQYLTKTSATDLAFTWATAPVIDPTLEKKTGRFHRSFASVAPGLQIPSANVTWYQPFFVRNTTTIDRLGFMTFTSFSGSATVRLGIYNNSVGSPTTVVVDGGTVVATTASTAYTVTISTTLQPGNYWLAVNVQSAAATNSYYGIGNTTSGATLADMGQAAISPALPMLHGYSETGITGAFATAGTISAVTASGPAVYARIA